ncbi:hypothetical protein NUU61_002023 [Penicillium alfredii]|uniref:Uncharacterized protein n=1 Tax=Penicillium alfredii TaxID=1506179 RepID=A0A9W9FQP9_9EURO|nr:uncharacterized protein NUU61_002023 [Penicillium alfredii]KAJ5104676.1 hypothetical protein NUU61_002023 [Penicillium alfredii]
MRVRVASVGDDWNGGRWAENGGLAHDAGPCHDHDENLDLCACPCHGVRGRGQRSTDPSTPDSYEIQP